jgi:hypothetical protein
MSLEKAASAEPDETYDNSTFLCTLFRGAVFRLYDCQSQTRGRGEGEMGANLFEEADEHLLGHSSSQLASLSHPEQHPFNLGRSLRCNQRNPRHCHPVSQLCTSPV